MQALNNYVIVKLEERKKETAGGLAVPDVPENSTTPARGVVVSIGSEVKCAAVGETVVFRKYDDEPFDKTAEGKFVYVEAADLLASDRPAS